MLLYFSMCMLQDLLNKLRWELFTEGKALDDYGTIQSWATCAYLDPDNMRAWNSRITARITYLMDHGYLRKLKRRTLQVGLPE